VRYLSVCSGIEAASVAWESLGWTPIGFSEIDKFPSESLAKHYPDVPNFGDMAGYKEWDIARDSVDLIVGGTPCQSFSVAGLQRGLEDPRGNLMLVYVSMVEFFRPEWIVWENVPGVLSSNDGRDFGTLLGALAHIGYGWSYRVLDAQYFGVPQRRRRVFLVGHSSGDPRRAAEILFEPKCVRGNTPSSRKERAVTATTVETSTAYATESVYDSHPNDSRIVGPVDVCPTVVARWGTGGGNTPLVQQTYRKSRRAQNVTDFETWVPDDVTNTLNCFDIGDIRSTDIVMQTNVVRRLMPIECERLQGFPDGWTDIRDNTSDSPRYKAIGNSMAVPCMKWIGNRIDKDSKGLVK
jgi:DNA (cytosine-5)-methyltransferase 1